MLTYETRIITMIVLPKGDSLYSERATKIYITDESAGEFITVSQLSDVNGEVRITPEEWPDIRAAIDKLAGDCREEQE